VDLEVGEREALLGARLPVTGRRQRADQVDALRAGGQDDRGGGVAAVDQVLVRLRAASLQLLVDLLDQAGVVYGAGVVATFTIRWGRSFSQVSL
jgi:hypothetical protein